MLAIRHGETAGTREGRVTGWRDIPLNEDGRRQCEATARRLTSIPLSGIYASPLERARTSAAIIAQPHRLPVQIHPEFREMRFGEWEGLSYADVATRFAESWAVWRNAPNEFVAPGGEALATVAKRVAWGAQTLRAAHEAGTIVLVAHGIVIRLLVLQALGWELARLWSVEAAPAGITELEYRPDGSLTACAINMLDHASPDLPR